MRRRRPVDLLRQRLGALSVILVLATGVAACGSEPPPAAPIRVERTDVAVKVSASGALTSVDSQNLGFRAGDRIKAINIKIGDVVRPGQVLATLDDLRPRDLRDAARATVDAAQASLKLVVDGVEVQTAVRLRDAAARSFGRTKASVDAQVAAARNDLRRAEVQFAYDLRDLRANNIRARASGCDTSRSDESNFTSTSRRPNPQSSLGAVASGTTAGGLDATGGMGDGSAMTPTTGSAGSTPRSTAAGPSAPTCVVADQAAATAAFGVALASKTGLTTARRALDVAVRGGGVTVESARTAMITADADLRQARVTRPNTIDQLRAQVDVAEASLSTAESNLRDTVLYAPVGGVVSAINGAVGEFAGGGSGTSAQSPGTNAPIPGVGAAASSDQAGSAASGISATRPGGAAFVQLNNTNSFQAVVPFEETDGVRVRPNQAVEVTFDSVPGFVGKGTVLSIAPNGVNISGVTNYYATVVIENTDPRLRSGLTAQTDVLVDQVDGVLAVPNAVVIRHDGRTYVLVPGADGQPPVEREFQAGTVGDGRTEVLSGLDDGQLVVPPPAPAPAG